MKSKVIEYFCIIFFVVVIKIGFVKVVIYSIGVEVEGIFKLVGKGC